MHLQQAEVGVEQHQGAGQAIGNRDVSAVGRDRDVDGIEADANLGNEREIPQIELADPPVWRREVQEAAVGEAQRGGHGAARRDGGNAMGRVTPEVTGPWVRTPVPPGA